VHVRELRRRSGTGGGGRNETETGGSEARRSAAVASKLGGPRRPSILVAVFSTPRRLEQRKAVRDAWRTPENVQVLFVMCDADPQVATMLRAEETIYSDIMWLPGCAESFSTPVADEATQKVSAALAMYVRDYSNSTPWFFKTDDDTYVRFAELLAILNAEDPATPVYAGHMLDGPFQNIPDRDPKSEWFEPVDTYPGETYPLTAAGGTGYAFSASLARRIVDSNIAAKNSLWNEDRAAAVWVKQVVDSGTTVKYLNVGGTDGYGSQGLGLEKAWCPPEALDWRLVSKEWKIVLFHNLGPSGMRCFSEIEARNEPAARVDCCYCAA
jgi:hypothetical protein